MAHPPPPPPPPGSQAELVAAARALTAQVAALTARMDTVVTQVADHHEVLWGPDDDRRHRVEPGIVAGVYELLTEMRERRVRARLITAAVSVVGVTTIVSLVLQLLRFVGGAP